MKKSNCVLGKEFIHKIPEKAGIYFLYNSKKKLIYIGKSINLKRRLKERTQYKYHLKFFYFRYILIHNDKQMDIEEKKLIKDLKPCENTKGKLEIEESIFPKIERLILRVYNNRLSKQKLITIPKKVKEIQSGDFVEVKKVKIK